MKSPVFQYISHKEGPIFKKQGPYRKINGKLI